MIRALTSRLLHLAALLVLACAIGRGFIAARHLYRRLPENCIEFVSSRTPTRTEAGMEEWRHGDTTIRIEGLAPMEFDLQRFPPWRHSLAPATTLTISPRAEPVSLQWEFSNLVPDRTLTLRLGDSIVQQAVLAVGHTTGQLTIPPNDHALALAFTFDAPPACGTDPRRITVTFWTLRATFP